MKLTNKVAIITGSASGLGRTGAMLFAKEGAKVVVSDIDDLRGEELARTISDGGGEATYLHADTSVISDLKVLVENTVDTYGELNIYWHNAGIAGPGRIARTSEDDFDRCVAVNLKGGFFGAKFAIPEIQKSGGGSILFTGSIGGFLASPNGPAYCISKTGLAALTKCLAVEFARDNIRVNCIAPGAFKTELWNDFINRNAEILSPVELENEAIQAVPMARFGELEEIAKAGLYLVTDDAKFITGVILPVDGGRLAGCI